MSASAFNVCLRRIFFGLLFDCLCNRLAYDVHQFGRLGKHDMLRVQASASLVYEPDRWDFLDSHPLILFHCSAERVYGQLQRLEHFLGILRMNHLLRGLSNHVSRRQGNGGSCRELGNRRWRHGSCRELSNGHWRGDTMCRNKKY